MRLVLAAQKFRDRIASIGLAAFDYGVFEIQDDDVGLAVGGLVHLLVAIAGREEPASHAEGG